MVGRMTTAIEPTPADDEFAGMPVESSADPARRANPDRPALRADDPRECIAAVPALLGFVPRRSLVVYLLRQPAGGTGPASLSAVARHDLEPPGRGGWARLATHLTALCVREDTAAVLALIVDDRAGAPHAGKPGMRAGRHRHLMRTLERALAAEHVMLDEVWAVREIAAGQPWWAVEDPAVTGVQSDPAASPIALAEAVDGYRIKASREDLESLVAVDDRLCEQVRPEVDRAGILAGQRFRTAIFRDELDRYRRTLLNRVLDRVATLAAAGTVDARALAETTVALRDPTVRDAVFALAGGHRAEAAARLWAQLCRALTGSDRAEAATLFGYSAYTRGDGVLAGIALRAALDADPDHTIARLLDTALGTGMPPHEIRKLAYSGRAKAAELGVEFDLRADWLQP
ncbi:hypothetical protein NRB20_07110 [Nocardia sp. RB20]|uniref:DUF4192 domain-containing protein n=2 Tax=Nocardia macrotermitis TaxID=2585198 RepID=A0A7K0CVW8_9NOCA|nr:hypothetical protein [Nocardia macrotermitis]